ncbi:hypothetical protein CDAR_532011 [Caerostris darwini]|uniref:Uncharacterized protein n=1 Tax=Caerostris darwini TaxID=1538125 RepID=A0AAV4R1J4_9ARAC|nr:hypothetical protein CDAR_532011 [Caerostris darwini]
MQHFITVVAAMAKARLLRQVSDFFLLGVAGHIGLGPYGYTTGIRAEPKSDNDTQTKAGVVTPSCYCCMSRDSMASALKSNIIRKHIPLTFYTGTAS